MQLDGEWRLGMAKDAEVEVRDRHRAAARRRRPGRPTTARATSPARSSGIAATSKKQNAAWELVKYMTTDTDAVVAFANAIHNVPSTMAALKSPEAEDRPGASRPSSTSPQHPKSNTTAGQRQRRRVPGDPPGLRLPVRGRQGRRTCKAGLEKTGQADRHRHRAGEVADETTCHDVDDAPSRACAKRRRSALRTAAFMSPWLIGFSVFFAYPLISTVYFSFMKYDGFRPADLQRPGELDVRLQRLPAVLAGPAQHAVAGAW